MHYYRYNVFQLHEFLYGRQTVKWYGMYSCFTFSLSCIHYQRSSFLTAEEIDPHADTRAEVQTAVINGIKCQT